MTNDAKLNGVIDIIEVERASMCRANRTCLEDDWLIISFRYIQQGCW
jgi:hypothetical protein